jgi:hypothetical protein
MRSNCVLHLNTFIVPHFYEHVATASRNQTQVVSVISRYNFFAVSFCRSSENFLVGSALLASFVSMHFNCAIPTDCDYGSVLTTVADIGYLALLVSL